MEDLLYETETAFLNFRHFLEQHELGKGLFKEINRHRKS